MSNTKWTYYMKRILLVLIKSNDFILYKKWIHKKQKKIHELNLNFKVHLLYCPQEGPLKMHTHTYASIYARFHHYILYKGYSLITSSSLPSFPMNSIIHEMTKELPENSTGRMKRIWGKHLKECTTQEMEFQNS